MNQIIPFQSYISQYFYKKLVFKNNEKKLWKRNFFNVNVLEKKLFVIFSSETTLILIHLSHGTKFDPTSPKVIRLGGGGLNPNETLSHLNGKFVFDHGPYGTLTNYLNFYFSSCKTPLKIWQMSRYPKLVQFLKDVRTKLVVTVVWPVYFASALKCV